MKLWSSNQYHNALQTNQQLPQSPQDLGVRLDQVPSFAKGLKAHGELPFWMCPVRWGYPTGAELVRHMWWVWSSYYLYVARARNHWCPGLYKVDFCWSSGAALPCSSLSERGIGIIGSALFSISKSSLPSYYQGFCCPWSVWNIVICSQYMDLSERPIGW